jgi:hypothetical protein
LPLAPIAKATFTTNTYGTFLKKNLHMGGQTKGGPGGEIFSFEKKRSHGCCRRLPWLLVLRWQLQWLFFANAFNSDNFQVF